MTSKQIEEKERAIYDSLKKRNGGSAFGSYAVITPRERHELAELFYRRMIISCICYGDDNEIYNDRTEEFGRYGIEYGVAQFGRKCALKIFRDQRRFMREHATIHKGVDTDCEGVLYNSITWR